MLKRVFDVLFSAAAIIISLPVWLVAVIGIEISDPGPLFYVANRIGYNNKPFRMLKFRSMRVDRSANENNFKADAKRVFKFGEFMRRLKIDELPQFINVLKGDMSIVGPRPASSDQADIVRGGRSAVASTVRPGLTSPSSLYDYIRGDAVADEEEYKKVILPTRLELDIYYINNMSLGYDIRIIWYTIVCIAATVFGKSPEKLLSHLLAAAERSESTAL